MTSIDENPSFEECAAKEFAGLLARAEQNLDAAEAFAEGVARDLARFESENLRAYASIAEQQRGVEGLVEQSLEALSILETRLDLAERALVNIRATADELEHYASWELAEQNKLRLLATLNDVLKVVDLSPEIPPFDLNATALPPELDRFSLQLIDVYQGNVPEGAIHVKAIKEKIDADCEVIKEFCEKFSHFVNELISSKFKSATRYLPSTREDVHNSMNIYAPIMSRVKLLDPYRYSEICDNYCKHFHEGYKSEWESYFNNFINQIPFYDINKYKKEGRSVLYREEKEFKGRCQLITEFIKNTISLSSKVSSELKTNANKFLQLTTREEISQDTVDASAQNKKRGGGEIKLDKMVKQMLDFIPSLMINYFNEIDRNDFFYISVVCALFNEHKNLVDNNRFYLQLIKTLLDECNDRIKNLNSVFSSQLDQKRSKKGNVGEILKLFKEFMATMSYGLPKVLEEASPLAQILKDVLNMVIEAVGYSYLETSEKVSKEIYLIENLYNLQVCVGDLGISVLSEDRRKIKQKYSEEIEKWVKGSITTPFSKLILLIEEIDKKVDAQCTLAAIEAYVQSSRSDYKKYAKDFNFKNVKKIIEKTHKTVKKQFTDPALFTTIWHLMSIEIIAHITKIHHNLKTYCSKIQEIHVDFEMTDLKQYISSVDMPA